MERLALALDQHVPDATLHDLVVLVQDLDLVLYVSVQREWQTALQEGLC